MQLCVVVIISFIILHMILIDNSSTQQVLSYSIQNIYYLYTLIATISFKDSRVIYQAPGKICSRKEK